MSNGGGDNFLTIFFGLIAVICVVAAVLTAIAMALSVGSVVGAGHATVNYVRAFRANVAPEKAGP